MSVPAACEQCPHWDRCLNGCQYRKERLVHELRAQAAALHDTLSKCCRKDLDRVLSRPAH